MLHEVVFAIACMVAIVNPTGPAFQLSVSLVLMSDPVGLALERFGFAAIGEGTSKRLYVFVNVLRPIGRLVKLLDLEAQGTFELSRKASDRR
jgi:hypothetical protein